MAGDAEVEGYSLFICDTDKIPETIRISATATSFGSSVTETQSTRPGAPTSSAPSVGASPAPAGTVAGAVAGSVGAYKNSTPG